MKITVRCPKADPKKMPEFMVDFPFPPNQGDRLELYGVSYIVLHRLFEDSQNCITPYIVIESVDVSIQ